MLQRVCQHRCLIQMGSDALSASGQPEHERADAIGANTRIVPSKWIRKLVVTLAVVLSIPSAVNSNAFAV